MRGGARRDPTTGFAEHIDELIAEFHREQDDRGLRAWLLELIGEAKDPKALGLFVAHLDDEWVNHRAVCGLENLDTKEARTALYRHRTNNAQN